MSNDPTYIQVTNFDTDHPEFHAVVEVWPNGVTRISERTGWTHDKDLDDMACVAARALAAEQTTVAAE